MNLLALLDRGTDHAQCGAVSSGGQRTGIAVSKHSAFARHERGAVAPHGLVGGYVFGVHALGFFDQILLNLCEGTNPHALELLLHAADRPEEIDGGWTSFADDVADLVELPLEVGHGLRLGVFHAESNSHGRRNADGRRSTHHHGADDIGHLLVCFAGDVSFFRGQLRLVDEAYAVVSPFESLNHDVSRWSSAVSRWSLAKADREPLSDESLTSMHRTAVARDIRHRRPSADFTRGRDGKNYRLGIIRLKGVFGTHVPGSENRNERRRGRCLLHAGTALRLFALHQAHHAGNLESELAGGFDRLHGGGAGGADIVNDHHARALLAKALDSLPRAVLLFGFAHKKPMQLAGYY